MRQSFLDLRSVGAKVIWIVVIVSAVAVVAVSLSSGIPGCLHLRDQMVKTVTSQAMIVALNSSAPLSFGDQEMADEALSALKGVEGLEQASLIDGEGRVFASFQPDASAVPLRPLYPAGHWRDGAAYALVVPVADRAGAHGRLQVNYNAAQLRREAMVLALEVAVLSIGATLLAWLLASRLHPLLTAPVLELEQATQRVRDTGDTSVRAQRVSNDELGRLTDNFNEMLQRIETSQRDLIQAQQRAEEASRLKDEFVATLSHELRTPLSPIVAWIHMLRLPNAAAQLPNGLDVMERNAKALIRIIDDLLDMSRIVSGTLRLDVQAVDIDTIIHSAVETLAPAAASRQLDVKLQLASSPPLRGDPSRLQQVVWNLLSNAIKFSPPGGQVTVKTLRIGTRLDIVIRDTGMGIDPAFLPFVFDRFRQQDGSITRVHGGLGLGLSIVRQLVELHGGTVSAQSPGRDAGSTFVVSLPVANAEPLAVKTSRSSMTSAGLRLDGVRVLVVEDETDMRAIICSALDQAGAVVDEAGSAREALVRFQRCAPDVLVSDIGLPDVDGYEMLIQLRRSGGPGAQVPAVALTAYARPEEQRRAFEAGYQMHLSKPVEPAALVSAVATAMGSSHGLCPADVSFVP